MILKSYSWTVLDNEYAIKKTDKSAFLHRGTGIPREIYHFFKVEDMINGEKREITLVLEGNPYSAYFYREGHENSRIRLFWDYEISKHLQDNFENHRMYDKEDYPELVFRPESDTLYRIFIVSDVSYFDDVDREDVFESYADGKEAKVYTTRYERDPRNRENAIRAHGRRCMVCDFHFEENYGDPGKGFIEVHHKTPVSEYEGELFIDPVQDMACLCSNCHRMIHRKRNNTLSVEELQEYYDKAQEKKRKNQL